MQAVPPKRPRNPARQAQAGREDSAAASARSSEGLVRGLGLGSAVAISVGSVVGSGIFVGVNRVAAGVESTGQVFLLWIAAGGASLLGAFVYAEFAAALPESGSDFVYVRRTLGPFWGFLTGWSSLTLNISASVAALALAFATQLDALKPAGHALLFVSGFAIKITAVSAIAFFTLVNVLGVKAGGRTQALLTALKGGLALALVGVGLWAWTRSGNGPVATFTQQRSAAAGTFSAAVVGALFATDGWNGITRVAGEVRDPQRTLPRALVIGMLAVVVLYLLLSMAYIAALGLDGMAGHGGPDDRLVASRAAQAVLGRGGGTFVTLVILASTLGAVNGLTLSGPRIYFAMARQRLFWRRIARVDPRHRTPAAAILFQSTLAVVLVSAFTFEQLTSYVVLSAWLSYLLCSIGLLRWRRQEPDHARPFRVPVWPWTPILFAVVAGGVLAYLAVDALLQAGQGAWKPLLLLALNVVVLGLAVPSYAWLRRESAPSLESREVG